MNEFSANDQLNTMMDRLKMHEYKAFLHGNRYIFRYGLQDGLKSWDLDMGIHSQENHMYNNNTTRISFKVT